ncbi:hypothetical protein N657DRAFT_685618 [Parathielavia appendiculata]|uniref:Uncharacterized protein n=1 Tax=Parathielavia appendiculata TaxID=2587402 RepID=A0AAN6TPH1_9PEZI|nr:hypothetical protein N657DRAFT_685618 [Parathielavia appendiculata]
MTQRDVSNGRSLGFHRCPVCFKTYKRREHLQRHRSSHTSERRHRCGTCGAAFQRSDVLRRHLQTCDGPAAPSSSRRRSCDRCVRQKKACNAAQPCLNCERRSLECRYSSSNQLASLPVQPAVPPADSSHAHLQPSPNTQARPGHCEPIDFTFDHIPFDDLDTFIAQAVSQFPMLDGPSPDPWPDNASFTQSQATTASRGIDPFPQERSETSSYRGYSFRFLSERTSRTGLVSSFECATLAQRQQVVAAFHQSQYIEQQPPDFLLAVPSLPISADEVDPQNPSLPLGLVFPETDLSSWSSWTHDPVVIKLQQVVLLVKKVVTTKPHDRTITINWSAALEHRCRQFFSPPRFAKFIELYWSVWHPNVNILHRPTFDTASSKPILLAAMALIGSCVSPDPVDIEDARMWFNCVEEMVFTDDDFCRDIEPPAVCDITLPINTVVNRPTLEALQAALIVCLYQNWEGTDASKRRIRRHRFSTVVSTARDVGIDTARHLDYTMQPKHEFNWGEYVMREGLIRIFMWVFLVDTAFVIYNNLPHRMVIKEMKMHMASPEACFQAVTAEECIGQIHRWMPPTSPFCTLLLREAIENICLDTMTPESQWQFAQLGPLNLFAMVSAIHYMIFQHQNLLAVEGQLVPIRNGLRNWIEIWEKYAEVPPALSPHCSLQEHEDHHQTPGSPLLVPELMWKRIGFIRFSPEYWLLGSLITDRLSAQTTTVTAATGTSALEQSMSLSAAISPGGGGGGGGGGSISSESSSSVRCGGVKARSTEPILGKYDQTSLRQLDDLITGFQKFGIGSS